jgi:phenylacetate-coenzyme A ligase PaaK-like adenylate-forming protein
MDPLADTLAHALHTVPYYAGASHRTLRDFPVIGKVEYVRHLDALLSTRFAGWPRTESPEAGALLCELTSGSSGYPLRCYKTVDERTRLGLSLLRKRRAIDPRYTADQLFGFIHQSRYRGKSHLDGLGNLAPDNIGRILTWLRDELRPPYLHGNPMLLLHYAEYIRKHRFPLAGWEIRFVESVAEPLAAEERRTIAEQFATRVVDCYGCLECYNVAYECGHGRMHANENVVVEILGAGGEELTGTGDPGEVVLTSLVNRAQPFIRYRTGDVAASVPSDCPCGSAQPVLLLTGRRKIDYVKLFYRSSDPRLRICGYDLFAAVLHDLLAEGLDELVWYNVVQRELTLFEVQHLARAELSPRFRRRFQELTEREVGGPVRLEFVAVPAAELPLINRKSRVFRSLLEQD